MRIYKCNIRNVIRYGVPESVLAWAQELGRAGRDGLQACATILYCKSDISHVNPWFLNISNRERCKRILDNFSDSWKYVLAHLAVKCRRRLFLDLFNEENTVASATGPCCDVCISHAENAIEYDDCKEELAVLIDALDKVGCKGEVKDTEWIRGSQISWTNAYDKSTLSYGHHNGRDIKFWRLL